MEKQTQNTTSWFKRLPILWRILGTAVILAGLLFASGEISFDNLTQIFGSKAGTNTSAWPMSGQNAQQTNRSPYDGPNSEPEEIWRTIEFDDNYKHWADVLISPDNNTLYASVMNKRVVAYDLQSPLTQDSDGNWVREKKWEYPLSSGYIGTIAPMAIAADGTLYVSSQNRSVSPSTGRLIALTDTGDSAEIKWSYDLASWIEGMTTLIVGPDDTAYIGTYGTAVEGYAGVYHDARVYAIDNQGGLKWEYSLGERYTNVQNFALSPNGDTLYMTDTGFRHPGGLREQPEDGPMLYAFDASTGDLEWQLADGGQHPTVASNGIIYTKEDCHMSPTQLTPPIPESCFVSPNIKAISPDGVQMWKYILPPSSANAIPMIERIALDAQNRVYASINYMEYKFVQVEGDYEPFQACTYSDVKCGVYALDSNDGNLRWIFQDIDSDEFGHNFNDGIILDQDGDIYWKRSKRVISLNSNGQKKWHYDINTDSIYDGALPTSVGVTGMAIANDGTFYMTIPPFGLIALASDGSQPQSPPTDPDPDSKISAWPMSGQNAQQTNRSPYNGPEGEPDAENIWYRNIDNGVYGNNIPYSDPLFSPDSNIMYFVGGGGVEAYDLQSPLTLDSEGNWTREKKWEFWRWPNNEAEYNPTGNPLAITDDGTIIMSAYARQGGASEPGRLIAVTDAGDHAEIKWFVDLDSKMTARNIVIGSDGTIYFGTHGQKSGVYPSSILKDAMVYAVSSEGDIKWTYSLGERSSYVQNVALSPNSNTLYVSDSGDRNLILEKSDEGNSVLYALDANTGSLNWKLTDAGYGPVVASNGTIYIRQDGLCSRVAYDGALCVYQPSIKAISSSGSEIWEYTVPAGPTGTSSRIGRLALDSKDRLYAAIYYTAFHNWHVNGLRPCAEEGVTCGVYAFNSADGTIRWTHRDDETLVYGSSTAGIILDQDDDVYWMSSGKLEFADSDGKFRTHGWVTALDSDGQEKWHHLLDLGNTGLLAHTFVGNYGASIGNDGTLYALSAEGFIALASDVAPPPPQIITLDRVEISPVTSTLQAGGEEAFTAIAYDSDGEIMDNITYTWTVAGGTTNTNTGTSIVYTAGNTAGDFTIQVSATDNTDTVEDTADITIFVPVPDPIITLDRVEISPVTSTLQPDSEQLFTATAYDSDGEVMSGITYAWTIAGGTTNTNTGASIVYTAGNTEGDFTILVSATDGIGTVADTSTVRIVIPIPQPTPPPPPIPQPIPEQPLPESGPEDVWMLLVLASLIGAGLVYKRQLI